MPPEGIDWKRRQDLLTYEEIHRVARVMVHRGVTKIRLTGGEPTARHEVTHLVRLLSQLEGLKTLAMTTNGLLLSTLAQPLKNSGLQVINISLDTLKPERYQQLTCRNRFQDAINGLDAVLSVGFSAVKLNVVVMKNINDDELLDFVAFVKDKPVNVRFIEFMPFKNNQWQAAGLSSYKEMRSVIESQYKLIPVLQHPSDVAKDFRIPGVQGTVSFITSMTDSFCDTCNRIRLTADGAIKNCLFGPQEVHLRDKIRQGLSDDALAACILQALQRKAKAHLPSEELVLSENRAMIEIGG